MLLCFCITNSWQARNNNSFEVTSLYGVSVVARTDGIKLTLKLGVASRATCFFGFSNRTICFSPSSLFCFESACATTSHEYSTCLQNQWSWKPFTLIDIVLIGKMLSCYHELYHDIFIDSLCSALGSVSDASKRF